MKRFNDDPKRGRKRKPVVENNHIAILRVLRQPVDTRNAMDVAWKAGFVLKNFQTDDNLELYYDIYCQGKRVCYLSKSWVDSGFRIGAYLEMFRSLSNFKERFQQVFDIATNNVISLCVIESNREKVVLSLQIGLYQGGFNASALREAVDVMDVSLAEVRRLIADD